MPRGTRRGRHSSTVNAPAHCPLPSPRADDAAAARSLDAIRRLQAAGHETYWAGGCVRDLLLGRSPRDYDIATAAPPERVIPLFPGAILVGKAFGVVRVPVDGAWFDVATFRRDHAYQDGRHPTAVSFVDARTDAQRRDFTVNALFGDPLAGRCLDFAGGLKDLNRRLVRAVGDPPARFREDHLRLLRAARFAGTLDFDIEDETAAAIRTLAPQVVSVSVERVRDELVRTLVESVHPGQAMRLLDELGLLAHLLPEVVALKAQAQPPEFHPEGDVFTHTCIMLDGMQSPTPRLAFSVLLHDIGKPPTASFDGTRIRFNGHAEVGGNMADAILHRLRFSNDDRESIVAAVRGHMHFQDVPRMRRATLRRFVGGPDFPMQLELHRLDCLACHGDLSLHAQVTAFMETLAREPAMPDPWIRGEDLMALGLREGPEIGRWLRAAYEAQLEGTHPDRDALLVWVRERVGVS